MKEESEKLVEEILAFIEAGDLLDACCFNRLALKLFSHQFKNNLPYKKYCQLQRKTPLTVKQWGEIPPMPIQGFKELTLSCENPEEAEAVFMTSGTTTPEKRGQNIHPEMQVWDASMKGPFKKYVVPDREKITQFVISPAENMNQNSSLARYLTNAVTFFGTEQSRFFFDEKGLDMAGLVGELRACEKNNDPVMIIGASFSFVHFLDYCEEQKFTFMLPKGSRIFDTGGFKGQSREVDKSELYQLFTTVFGIPLELIINMYGMTELSSQIYDQNIYTYLQGEAVSFDKKGPAWVKTVVVDTDTLSPVKKGEKGVLVHIDLANWNSCLAILTEDLGYETDKGFVLLGRVEGSEARGCSLAVDQLLSAGRQKL